MHIGRARALGYSEEERREIFDANDGRCCYCGKHLSFSNYDRFDERGNWNVAHIIPKRYGIEDRIPIVGWNNYLPACISCNSGDQKGRLWLAKFANWFFFSNTKYCPKCGARNESKRDHCNHCGGKLPYNPVLE